VFGCAIAGLGIWLGVSQLFPDAGPAEARAEVAGLEVADEILAEFSGSKPPFSPTLLREWRVLAAADWPADPFFRQHSPLLEENAEAQGRVREPSVERPRLVLNAIVSGAKPLAMINGLVVLVGDRLADGSVITAIEDYVVRLEGPQGPWTLRLSE
jgi:hypothetical protein